ncbi:MAG: hypothetical protein DDT19_00206 [Syntrophomonadaceae bacterium]|nr:hypothetical protein [Bacillota bacterium]
MVSIFTNEKGADIHRRIDKSITQGIDFLANRQLPSGEFTTMRWEKPNVQTASYVKSVFVTSFVLHSLKYVVNFNQVREISQRAIRFLLDEMEQNGLWRFFGKNSHVHFDVDTVCCVLASLKEWGVEIDYYSLASLMLKYRDNQGRFYTWILDVDPPFKKKDNNIDWVVNANVLFFYRLLNEPLRELEQYLTRVVKSSVFQRRSAYYEPFFAFFYCLTRAYAGGGDSRLGSVVARTKNYLPYIEVEHKLYGDSLEKALAAVGILNLSGETKEAAQAIEHLLDMQGDDGGWQIGVFHTEGPYTKYRIAYGSRELTTAIALEALSKYSRQASE